MNSASAPAGFKTSDGSPWWLRATASTEPKGTYYANCFLGLKYGAGWGANAENNIQFDADRCQYHSASYYCQKKVVISTKPKDGSPKSCACTLLELKGKYSAGSLMKCENCLSVSKSTQKNSCPVGTKLWAPRNRDDWKTFLASGLSSLRAPHWIVDVTRPVNGPGCCGWSAKNYNFNSGEAHQSAWKTADGAPWWLRSSKYNEPNGDYHANCYLDLWRNPSTADDVQWNDGNCNYHSKSYYCQPEKGAAPPPTPPPPTPPPTPAPVPQSAWDLSGNQDFILKARFKTTASGGTIVGKAFTDGLWKSGGGAGQGKMVFLRGGKVGMDIGWVGYFSCSKAVNDGKWHDVALKYVKSEGNQYQLFVDDMKTSCKKGLRAVNDHPDLKVYIGKAIGHRVSNGVANGDMAPAMKGEVTQVSYQKLGR